MSWVKLDVFSLPVPISSAGTEYSETSSHQVRDSFSQVLSGFSNGILLSNEQQDRLQSSSTALLTMKEMGLDSGGLISNLSFCIMPG